MPDRYSADEARRIFARAARRQHAAPAEDGLTLDELAEIARSAGLDPSLVRAEATSERVCDGHRATWHGVPVGVRRARLLPDRVSDREWERIVDLVRAEFKLGGTAQQIGTRREWSTGTSSSSTSSMSTAYTVTVEQRPDGDLVTVEAPNTYQMMGYIFGGTIGFVGLMLGAMGALLGPPGEMGNVVLAVSWIAAAALALYAVMWMSARVSARRTPDRFESLLDRIDLASRTEPASAPPATTTGRIDPVHLDAEADRAGSTSSPHRVRA
ncbi:hypothetical protein [Rubrivirga marina]|uniref:Uncharacterized protein n=1 Tax=Rubrivirga marina TaxID=1196024 RepID=A0A271J4A4_9BACT|nr:hypothetical protein [Rubrivirga marina]PAP78342.1 hypothetical protein BSZ37_18905 [Rubrivirga marina]